MRILTLPLLLCAAYLSGVEEAPKLGDDAKLDARIATRFDAKHQPLVYRALADNYAISEADGKAVRLKILTTLEYGEYSLERDMSALGLRGKARENALDKFDEDHLAQMEAYSAKLEAENAKLDLELKAQEEERAKQKKQGEQSKSPKP